MPHGCHRKRSAVTLKAPESINFGKYRDLFRLCPPSTLCAPQLQSTCHYIVNHYVKILHVRLGGANNMRPLSWGGTNGKDPNTVLD